MLTQVDARAKDGRTALIIGAGGLAGPAMAELLVRHGAGLAARDARGRTALHAAAMAESTAMVGGASRR
jgi:ankyrin repeat protein